MAMPAAAPATGVRRVAVVCPSGEPLQLLRRSLLSEITARRHKLPSEASRRFERGVDPEVAPAAAARVVQLLEQLGGGHADELGSAHRADASRTPILLPHGYVGTLVGVDATQHDVMELATRFGADRSLVKTGDPA